MSNQFEATNDELKNSEVTIDYAKVELEDAPTFVRLAVSTLVTTWPKHVEYSHFLRRYTKNHNFDFDKEAQKCGWSSGLELMRAYTQIFDIFMDTVRWRKEEDVGDGLELEEPQTKSNPNVFEQSHPLKSPELVRISNPTQTELDLQSSKSDNMWEIPETVVTFDYLPPNPKKSSIFNKQKQWKKKAFNDLSRNSDACPDITPKSIYHLPSDLFDD